jgi:AcrR family transcriptional regulator
VTGQPQRSRQPRAGRRSGDSGTREAILAAARRRFAERGYDGATIRGIAADAGVDPALVHHFYGSKEALFAAAMHLPMVPSEVLTAAFAQVPRGATLGEHLVRTALAVWESDEVHGVFIGLLRSALTSDRAADMFREFITHAILAPVAAMARPAAQSARRGDREPDEAAYRAAAVASQMLGLAMTRYLLRLGPIATADPAELAATIGPTIDRYLTGDILPGRGRLAR